MNFRFAAFGLTLLTACLERGAFVCKTEAQCVSGTTAGICEPAGLCSFPDSSCPQGRRYGQQAGEQSSRCVPALCAQNAVVQVAAGDEHACARRRDGRVQCWGRNDHGHVSTANEGPFLVPTDVRLPGRATLLSLGADRSCAIVGAAVYCWGGSDSKPVTLLSATLGWTRMVVGSDFVCGGSAAAGTDCIGGSGNGVRSLSESFTMLAAHGRWLCGPTAGSTAEILCGLWPEDPKAHVVFAPVHGTSAIALAIISDGACALSADGGVRCWKLGKAVPVEGWTAEAPVPVPPLRSLVGAGARLCGATRDGKVVLCWQPGSTEPQATVELRDVQSLTAGAGFACAVTRDGRTACWGDNRWGQLGSKAQAPQDVATPTDVRQVVAGLDHSCAALVTGGVMCWGRGSHSQLGDAGRTDQSMPVTVRVPEALVDLRAAGHRVCGRTLDRRLWCWGRGDPDTVGAPPAVVEGLAAVDGFAISGHHSCAVSRGRLYCWGTGAHGELGDPAWNNLGAPTPVRGLEGVVEVIAGDRHTCARLGSGDVYCFGSRAGGRLGDGMNEGVAPPTRVDMETVVSLVAGHDHTCVRGRDSGRVACWGAGARGQLGLGDRNARAIPTTVPGLATVATLSAGIAHTCAVTELGALLCFGANDSGQAGLARGDRLVPESIATADVVTGVAAGGAHTCFLSKGRVRCLGAQDFGQWGDGRALISATPLPLLGDCPLPDPAGRRFDAGVP